MSKKDLSSDLTPLYKFGLPFWWLLLMGIGLLIEMKQRENLPLLGILTYFLVLLVGSYLTIPWAVRLKFVSVDDSFLYISSFNKHIKVPLGQVKEVRQSFFARGMCDTVVIILQSPSKFGQKITFVPKLRKFGDTGFRKHPTVKELERLIYTRA